jgi:hypothetical protein
MAATPARFGISAYASKDGHEEGFVYGKAVFENKESCENFVATNKEFAVDQKEFIGLVAKHGGDVDTVRFACEPIKLPGQDV